MVTAPTLVRRGQPAWLLLVASATVVMPLAAFGRHATPLPELMPAILGGVLANAAIPGVIALSQYMLVRTGRMELSVVGVASLSSAVIGVNSAHGNAGTLVGLLAAALLALPFALISAFLAVKADMGYAMVAAVAVVLGADQLVTEVAPETVNADAGLMAVLGAGTYVPVAFLVAAALFAGVAWCAPRQQAALATGTAGWVRTAFVLYVPAFLLAVLAGLLYTARVQAATPQGLGEKFVLVCVLAVVAGGASLKAHRASLADVAVGSLFTGSFSTFLYVEGVSASRFNVYVAVACLAFILLDCLRLRRVPAVGTPAVGATV
ncbi:hypothetical protein OG906_02805 [Streptomyces sp. NBC_01426]|uniref:hypothetical protein n=1 Tax=Streptomyces sp. NBC_01426 TaxID=2975866 RepID=UPI002E3693F8|nr:hypothetical protein [Streptomyces sp. NBC_01426]